MTNAKRKEILEYIFENWSHPEIYTAAMTDYELEYIGKSLGFQIWKLGKECSKAFSELIKELKKLFVWRTKRND